MQGKDGPGKDSRGTLPRPCNSAYGPGDKKCLQSQPQASEQLILQKLGLFLTCHMVPHTLWRDASPKSVPTTSGYVSTAPGLGLPGGLATPHLQSGREGHPLSLSMGIYVLCFIPLESKMTMHRGPCLHSTDVVCLLRDPSATPNCGRHCSQQDAREC